VTVIFVPFESSGVVCRIEDIVLDAEYLMPQAVRSMQELRRIGRDAFEDALVGFD
jgi:hypothetical protein